MSVYLGDGLFAWAQTVSRLAELLDAGLAMRFYPVALTAPKSLPYIVYEEEKDAEAARHEAPATAATSRVKFLCVAASPTDAAELHQALYEALLVPRFSGQMGYVYVQAVLYESSSPAYQWEEQQFAVDAEYKFAYNLS